MSAGENHFRGIDLSRYAVIPIWYHCNNDCSICMLAKVKNRLDTVNPAQFRSLVRGLVKDGRYDGLILSGAEITTFEHLELYVREAASYRRFKKIQIQTNGRHLASPDYVERLVDAGVNEFFISVHGMEPVHDAITRVPGSFRETMEAIANLAGYPVNIITNTVLTRINYHEIVPLLRMLCAMPIHELHIWNYFPMERSDTHDMIVSIPEVTALFPDIVKVLSTAGKQLVLKGFPECISPGDPCFIDSRFPLNLIQDDFWAEFGKNGFATCYYREMCSSKKCWALSRAYIEKFGDEHLLLSPRRGGQE